MYTGPSHLHVLPPLPRVFLPRPHLESLLRYSVRGALTLVTAPPGFGKTALVAAWAHQQQDSVIWVSLDANDNDPARFLRATITAVQTREPAVGVGSLALLRMQAVPELDVVVASFHSELAAMTNNFVIVLDNYHLITVPAIHHAMAALLDHCPPNVHVMLLSRTEPPLPLARWRTGGHLTEIRAAQLQFTLDETARFLTDLIGLPLSAKQIAALAVRTEGWPAGIQLAGLALLERDPSEIAAAVEAWAGSHRYILDYLVEEVFQKQPAHLQQFLLQTSILDRLSGSLCDAVMGVSQESAFLNEARDSGTKSTWPVHHEAYSQVVLTDLERRNLFLVPLDDSRHWYRYHSIFSAALRSRLQTHAPELVRPLHRRAAFWLNDHGFGVEAVRHALASEDFDYAAALVEQHAQAAWQQGESVTLRSWLDALPSALSAQRPWLAIWDAWLLLGEGQWSPIAARIAAADRALVQDPAPSSALLGALDALRAHLARVNDDPQGSIAMANQALTHLPLDEYVWRTRTLICRASALAALGAVDKAARAYGQLATQSAAGGDVVMALIARGLEGNMLLQQGRLTEAAVVYDQTLRQAADARLEKLPVTAYALVGYGRIQYERDDLAAAAAVLETGIERGQAGHVVDVLLNGSFTLAAVRQAQDDAAGAFAALQHAQALAERMGLPPVLALVEEQRAWLQLRLGDIAAVKQWSDRFDHSLPALLVARTPGLLLRAYLFIRAGHGDAAMRLLDAFTSPNGILNNEELPVLAQLLRPLVLQAQGQTDAALVALLPLVAWAERERVIRMFADLGAPMAALLRLALASREWGRACEDLPEVRTYARRLLTAFPLREHDVSQASPTVQGADVALAEPLSPRELEVLRLLASGASNHTIAATLVIALPTVKRHVSSVLAKLDATNRTEAVARALSLGLLTAD